MNEGIRLEGFIELELENKKENYRKVYKNTITKGGKQFLLAHSASQMLGMSASMRGNAIVNGGLVNRYISSYSTKVEYNANSCLTNMLLHLDTLQEGLTESSTFVNLFDTTGIIDTKVVGYANNNVSPTANGKEGTIDYCKDVYVADGYAVCERWKYPEGIATGVIDTIAMAPSGWKGGNALGGQRFSKCIDRVNQQQATYSSSSKQFCVPGITGFTSNDEILLNYNQDSVAQHKYNISTGEITDNPTTWFVFPERTTSVEKIGEYVYSVQDDGKITVWLASTMAQVTTMQMYIGYGYTIDNYRLFKDSNNVLWGTASYAHDTNVGLNKFKLSGAYFGQLESYTYSDWSNIVTLPSGISQKKVNFATCGGKYIMYVKGSNYATTHKVYTAIVFTNTQDIMGSIVDVIPEVYSNTCLFAYGSNIGAIDIGCNGNTSSTNDKTYDSDTMYRNIVNNSGSKDILTTSGLYLTMSGWYNTLFSFVKLSEAITKKDTDILYVSYGYKIV